MIRQLEVDGVPTLLAPTTGPIHAGLAFRVGTADETLPQRGITHLIEHLALHSAGIADYHYNGATGVSHTFFHLRGSEAHVVQFLNGVCESLVNLPTARLAVEKDILRTEAAGRGERVQDDLATWRYGARGYGTNTYPEWGLATLTDADLQAWVGRYSTAQNAVLWLAADEVPAGLRIKLPQGRRQPLPATSWSGPSRPPYVTGEHRGLVAWSVVVPLSPAGSVFAAVLERSLRRALRQEAGLSYVASTDYEPHGQQTAMVTAYADALPEKQGAVLGGVVDVLAAMRVGGSSRKTSTARSGCWCRIWSSQMRRLSRVTAPSPARRSPTRRWRPGTTGSCCARQAPWATGPGWLRYRSARKLLSTAGLTSSSSTGRRASSPGRRESASSRTGSLRPYVSMRARPCWRGPTAGGCSSEPTR